MKHCFIIALSLISGIILNSCSSVDMFLNPDEYEKKSIRTEPFVTKEFVYDTVFIKNDGGDVIAGERPNKELRFSRIGQEFKFQNGESIKVILDGIDINNTTFDMVTDEATKEITIKLISKDEARVLITDRCQTINRYNTNYVPKVEFASGIPMEQVITTPICDDDCNVIGYQIRYGARERGCRDQETDKLYKKFKFCSGTTSVKKRGSSSRTSATKCQKLQKMGLPCK